MSPTRLQLVLLYILTKQGNHTGGHQQCHCSILPECTRRNDAIGFILPGLPNMGLVHFQLDPLIDCSYNKLQQPLCKLPVPYSTGSFWMRPGTQSASLGYTFQLQWTQVLYYSPPPPFPLISWVVCKIKGELTRVILITPFWPRKVWFPILLSVTFFSFNSEAGSVREKGGKWNKVHFYITFITWRTSVLKLSCTYNGC